MASWSPLSARHHEDDDGMKPPSTSARSPATVFAVDDLNSVFRVPDAAVERGSLRAPERHAKGACGRRRALAPRPAPSFATDGELSTFSEDTEEDDAAGRPQASIFRPASGAKRHCEEPDAYDHNGRPRTPTKRRACGAPPLLRHANPVRSEDEDQRGFAFSSPFRPSASPFSALFTETATPLGGSIQRREGEPSPSTAPQHLSHPLANLELTQFLEVVLKDNCKTEVL